MLKDGLPRAPPGTEEVQHQGPLPLAYAELDEGFRTLLDDDELEEALREFLVGVSLPG